MTGPRGFVVTTRERRDPVRRLFGLLIAGAGLLDLASVLSPPAADRIRAIDRLVPLAVPHTANVLVVQAGFLLLFLARQLVRGKRRAWQAALVLLTGSALLHVVKGLDFEEASASAALAAGLFAARARFRAGTDAPSFTRLVRLAPLLLAFPYAYGLAGIALRRASIGGWPGWAGALEEISKRVLWMSGPLRYTGQFGRWFPASLTALGTLTALFVLYLAFRPVVLRAVHRLPEDDAAARRLVADDPDTLAYFALRDDKALFFEPRRTAALGYRVVGGVALVSGNPVGPPPRWRELLTAFTSYAHERGWRVAALGATEDATAVWASLGFRTLYIGDEAVVDPQAFTLEGRRVRRARQSIAHVERQGFRVEWHRSGDLNPDLARALLHVSEGWKGENEERGFSMSLGRLFDRRDPDCLVAVARDADDYARGFLHFVPVGDTGYSLDVMRRDHDTPSGLNELLIAKTLEHLRERGIRQVSLNFAFLRGILRPPGRLTVAQRFQRLVAVRLGPWFQIESLYRFNNKFDPVWRPRYAAYEDTLAVPSVLLAALRAEKLLDLGMLRRSHGGRRLRQIESA